MRWLTGTVGVVAVLAIAFVLSGLLWERVPYRSTATIADGARDVDAMSLQEDTVFAESRLIEWTGRIEGVLVGGLELAVRRVRPPAGEPDQFAVLVPTGVAPTEGLVRISGRWVGMSCAYRDTVFGGRCVPDVIADRIEQLPIEPE